MTRCDRASESALDAGQQQYRMDKSELTQSTSSSGGSREGVGGKTMSLPRGLSEETLP